MPDVVQVGGVQCRRGKPLPEELEEFVAGSKEDILAHANTKLFITHGGLLSTQEAIYHGVPMVGMPLYFDQDLNINRYVESEIAVFVEILNMKERDLSDAIELVLNNHKYTDNIKAWSTLFRDRPQSAVETAVFWSEYVMRHKGAPQLRSISRKLNFFQYHSLDVAAFLLILLAGGFCLIAWGLKKLVWKLFGSSCKINQKKLQ
ncbi:unnamed protein product [Allacma fusca]|uniref:UDP-glycosyltransferase n=1 Tax=Allacma fusca TaxID=39272 RepID=A0A8J2PHC1_9HEXA|nr:unnamed protein product [Allacma fusca]